MTDTARVKLWGSDIGAVTWLGDREIGVFQYEPSFIESGIELSPLQMPLREFPYEFPGLDRETFRGLPGLLADSLPDKFGNAVINAWLSTQNRSEESFHPVERLCYTGTRGMGALEFEPAILGPRDVAKEMDVEHLVELANRVLDVRAGLGGVFSGDDDREVIEDILRVGTSAGGARAKAVLAWNRETDVFYSGQLKLKPGFEHWIMKFDGVSNNRDKELADPQGYGKIEMAYHWMAVEAGLLMSECRLHHEGGRSHFMTKRFDRTENGGKLHMQSLGAMAHFDFNRRGAYSYEQALQIIKRLGLPRQDLDQQVIRAMFNVVARNQDDHVKNIAFLMDRMGEWRLAPAYDVTYAYNPQGDWTGRHQMSVNGKHNGFERGDLLALAASAGIKTPKANELIDNVIAAVSRWPEFAQKADVLPDHAEKIMKTLRTNL